MNLVNSLVGESTLVQCLGSDVIADTPTKSMSLCVAEICDAVRTSQTLDWLDLTACNLTHEGARAVGVLIKVRVP